MLPAKRKFSKRILALPPLKLDAVHMATNLMDNMHSVLQKYTVERCYTWTGNTVVLYWLKNKHGCKEYINNRVLKLNGKNYIELRSVSTQQNPADIISHGCKVNKMQELWTTGPSWQVDQSKI